MRQADSTTLTPDSLISVLASAPPGARWWVAYSGGLDSQVLLHLLGQLQSRFSVELNAVYVDHGLSPYAADWGEHCRLQASALDIPFQILQVNAAPERGQSPEAAAREARYQAFAELIKQGDVLMTAHHQDDQAETLLLQLLRGAGPKGLASMGRMMAFSSGHIFRPLLGVSQAQLQAYAQAQSLEWVEDESNLDTGFDRNYLRHHVMPALGHRWPAAQRTLARSAEHCAEAAQILAEVAAADLISAAGNSAHTLSINALTLLSQARRKNLLRHWVGVNGLPLPSEIKLKHILNDVICAAQDRNPCVTWPGAEVRRYQGMLYAIPPLAPVTPEAVIDWPDPLSPLRLPDGSVLQLAESTEGLRIPVSTIEQGRVTIRFRRGGERIRPATRGGHHSLKKLCQEAGIETWRRPRLPLLYIDEQLAAVIGLCIADEFSAELGKKGYSISEV